MVLKSEKKKRRLIIMNKLPDEIVLSILSRLTMKEVARARVVSRKWDDYWHHIQVLNLEDPIKINKMVDEGLKNLRNYPRIIQKSRFDYVNWVNNVLNSHLGCTVVEFKVAFYLNMIHQPAIDKWVLWAFSKHVEIFKLDLTPPRATGGMSDPRKNLYVLDLPLLKSCCNTKKFHLTSLCLRSVDVTTQAMECFLHTCGPTLEYLCIQKSNVLTRITNASLPSLKYFKLYDCPKIEDFNNVKAPKLVSFKYYSGYNPVLRLFSIQSASTLSHLSVQTYDEDCFFGIFRSLSKYFSHLEYLKLLWKGKSTISPVLDNYPALANLKHLKLFAILPVEQTLASWIPFIGACPLLQKLTMELRGRLLPVWPKIECHDKRPLLCMKTLEIKLFNGYNVDIDIANFVLQNAPCLEEVILHISEVPLLPLNLEAPLEGVRLELPPHVNLVMV